MHNFIIDFREEEKELRLRGRHDTRYDRSYDEEVDELNIACDQIMFADPIAQIGVMEEDANEEGERTAAEGVQLMKNLT